MLLLLLLRRRPLGRIGQDALQYVPRRLSDLGCGRGLARRTRTGGTRGRRGGRLRLRLRLTGAGALTPCGTRGRRRCCRRLMLRFGSRRHGGRSHARGRGRLIQSGSAIALPCQTGFGPSPDGVEAGPGGAHSGGGRASAHAQCEALDGGGINRVHGEWNGQTGQRASVGFTQSSPGVATQCSEVPPPHPLRGALAANDGK